MRKFLAVLILVSSSTVALADGGWGHHHGGWGGHHENHYNNGGGGFDNFAGPLIVGSILGLALSQPRYEQPRVIYQQEPYYPDQNCTGWVETIDRYGNYSRTRTCY